MKVTLALGAALAFFSISLWNRNETTAGFVCVAAAAAVPGAQTTPWWFDRPGLRAPQSLEVFGGLGHAHDVRL